MGNKSRKEVKAFEDMVGEEKRSVDSKGSLEKMTWKGAGDLLICGFAQKIREFSVVRRNGLLWRCL